MTRLPSGQASESAKLRVRLDLENIERNILTEADGNGVPQYLDKNKTLDSIAWSLCALLVVDQGPEQLRNICDEKATIRVTGLVGLHPKMTKRLFSSFETKKLDITRMRFITFELDLLGSVEARAGFNTSYIQYLQALGVRTIDLMQELKEVLFF